MLVYMLFQGSGRGGGSHMHRSGASKNVCQVEGCSADLRGLRDYHVRYKICEHHLKVSVALGPEPSSVGLVEAAAVGIHLMCFFDAGA